MHSDANRMRKRPLRMRSSSHPACLLCYLLAFSLPLVWEYTALELIYPWKLAATAPDVTAHLLAAFPFLDRWISPTVTLTGGQPFSLRDLLAVREQVWLTFLGSSAVAAWSITLLIQLLWRFMHRKPFFSARHTARAIRSYRLTMIFLWLMNAAVAAAVWVFGVQFITGRTLWDYLVCFGIYLLNPLAAAFVSRLAASPAISGKHAFFHRL